MAKKRITKPGQLDLFLKKEGVYNIDGDKVKPEDLKGYYKEKYNTGKYDHDISGYKRREALSKGIQAKKLLGIKLSEEDKNFKSNKQYGERDSKLKQRIDKAKKLGSKVMPKKLKILKSLLSKKKPTKPKPPTKKKSGGRLNDGTAFIKSLYKDKL
jgi:hypothetical protein